MVIAGIYSFNGGQAFVDKNYPELLKEVKIVISRINAMYHKSKISEEKTMIDKLLYSPKSLNIGFKEEFSKFDGWRSFSVPCEYPTEYYTADYKPKSDKNTSGAFRAMDFVKSRLGVEVQFGKYAFMVYNVCAKMTIFNKLAHINAGIEIVPIKQFANEMSTGVSYFEQFVWDLTKRGESNIDIPVLILGIDDIY